MTRQGNANNPDYHLRRYFRLMGIKASQFNECAEKIDAIVQATLLKPEAPSTRDKFVSAALGEYSYLQHICVAGEPDFQKLAQENQWASRTERGYSSKKTRIYDFVLDVYKEWLAKGMTLDDFQSVDKAGHKQFIEYLVGNKQKPPQELLAFVEGRTKRKPYPRAEKHGNYRPHNP